MRLTVHQERRPLDAPALIELVSRVGRGECRIFVGDVPVTVVRG